MSVSPDSPNTISFTSARAELLFTNDHLDELNKPERRRRVGRTIEMCRRAREEFKEIINDLHEPVRDQIDAFIDSSLDVEGKHLFSEHRSERLHGAFLQLDLQTTDHPLMFDMIERHVKKRKKIHFVRISHSLIKKRNLLEILDSVKHHSTVFILIEQTETLTNCLTETLISHVRGKLQDLNCPTKAVLFLFGVSTFLQVTPIDTLDCFYKLRTISLDKEALDTFVKQKLLLNDGANFRLKPDLFHTLYDCYIEGVPSIVNLELMYNYVCYEYNMRLVEPETLPAKKRRTTVKDSPDDKDLDAACQYHHLICDQSYKYYHLLHELGLFPFDETDIYDELFAHEELGKSTQFYDSVNRLKKLSSENIIKRINRVETNCQAIDKANKFHSQDMFEILMKYKSRLENNDQSEEMVKKLIKELLNHGWSLANPEKLNFGFLYIGLTGFPIERIIYSARDKKILASNYGNDDTYYGALFNLITTCPGHIYINQLYSEFYPKLRELILKNSSQDQPSETSTKKASSSELRSRKSKSKSKAKAADGNSLSEKEIDQLAKSIFHDLISDLEQNQIIKQDRRASQRGKIRRIVWP